MVSRRDLLKGLGAFGAAAALPPGVAWSQERHGETETRELQVQVFASGRYHYLPFDVPPGVNRVAATYETDQQASLGIGLFDQRGPTYQTDGFRGVYGAERRDCFVAAHEASQSFLPGPIDPGTWTVLIAVFEAPLPTTVTVTVELTYGPQRAAAPFGPPVGVVDNRPGWYRGDLHCHTPESSDAWASGTAMSPSEWAQECRRIGLDYASMTDHNVISQNLNLRRDAGNDVLLIAGEEMTNWFHGHATVAGLEPGDWLDWRQRPEGVPLQEHEKRVRDFLATAREMGTYVAAAHPFFLHLSWQFFAESAADPRSLPDGIEVWTAQFRPDCETALQYWHGLLEEGHRVFANGGSDLHGTDNDLGFYAGTPTTVVYAERLETTAVVEALRSGRSFITRLPDGVEIYLTATGPNDQHQAVGGTIYGSASDTVLVEALVRKAAGMRLHLFASSVPARVAPISSDEETVTMEVPIGSGGFVRAEVRGEPYFNPDMPLGSRMDMEAFTNPIFLVNGPEPDDNEPFFAPPPEGDDERGRPRNGDGGGADREDRPPSREPSRTLPATGGGVAVAGAAALAGGGALSRLGTGDRTETPSRKASDEPVAMTLSEVIHRAGTGHTLHGRRVRIAGQVTALTSGAGLVVTRWTPDCCGREDGAAVEIELTGEAASAVGVGDWVTSVATWVDGSGTGPRERPRLEIETIIVIYDPPPRRDEAPDV